MTWTCRCIFCNHCTSYLSHVIDGSKDFSPLATTVHHTHVLVGQSTANDWRSETHEVVTLRTWPFAASHRPRASRHYARLSSPRLRAGVCLCVGGVVGVQLNLSQFAGPLTVGICSETVTSDITRSFERSLSRKEKVPVLFIPQGHQGEGQHLRSTQGRQLAFGQYFIFICIIIPC